MTTAPARLATVHMDILSDFEAVAFLNIVNGGIDLVCSIATE